ncbi:MAG: BTAD domain-containing putative transcriptional regulator [Chloroflexota bacterium]
MYRPGAQLSHWPELLLNDQYQKIGDLLDRAQAEAARVGDLQRAALLVAAAQLNDSCAQMGEEVAYHEQVYRQLEARQTALVEALRKVLEMVEPLRETAVAMPQGSVWQRLTEFWRQRKPAPVVSTGPAPPHLPAERLAETAVAVTAAVEGEGEGERPLQPNDSAIPQLTIYCLGAFRVYEDEIPVEEWPSRKGKAIFKYLLLHRQTRITKEVLMNEFWPEATAESARNNLNVAIYGLRQALRNGYPEFSHVLFQDDCYFLNPEMQVWLDVEQFDQIFRRANQLVTEGKTAVALPDLHAAELLYQGELLAEDPYEAWPAARRQQLQWHYMQLLTHLCDYYFRDQQYATCITFANKLLRVEPCHEPTHRLLMRAYVRQRQRYLALRQYHHCVERLDEELAVPPDPTTTTLYEAIRNHEPI